jgi:CheY-like chemotaxis protein
VPCTGCILIVEDDRDLREALAGCFEELGCTVVGASDGLHALDALAASRVAPCFILSDLMMPRLDGAGLAALVRERGCRGRAVPFLSMSAGSQVLAPPVVDAHLQKPFRFEELLPTVERLCQDPASRRRPR